MFYFIKENTMVFYLFFRIFFISDHIMREIDAIQDQILIKN